MWKGSSDWIPAACSVHIPSQSSWTFFSGAIWSTSWPSCITRVISVSCCRRLSSWSAVTLFALQHRQQTKQSEHLPHFEFSFVIFQEHNSVICVRIMLERTNELAYFKCQRRLWSSQSSRQPARVYYWWTSETLNSCNLSNQRSLGGEEMGVSSSSLTWKRLNVWYMIQLTK